MVRESEGVKVTTGERSSRSLRLRKETVSSVSPPGVRGSFCSLQEISTIGSAAGESLSVFGLSSVMPASAIVYSMSCGTPLSLGVI